MIGFKIFLGYFSVALGFIAYGFYFRDIFLKRTKPHAFSWFIWGLITTIAFYAQIVKGAGAGAWATGTGSLVCFIIGFFALNGGERRFSCLDWVTLIFALAAILLWFVTNDPLGSVIVLSITDVIGSTPTFLKSFNKPDEETAKAFAMHSIKFFIAIVALQSYSLATWLFPATLACVNGVIAIFIISRRNGLSLQANGTSRLQKPSS